MTFEIEESRFWELVAIEEECNCDIIAGKDYGANIGRYIQAYLSAPAEVFNREKLLQFLTEELREQLPLTEIETIASELELQVQERVQQRKLA